MIRIEAHKSDVRALAVGQMHIYSAGRDCKVGIYLGNQEILSHSFKCSGNPKHLLKYKMGRFHHP